MLSRRRCCCGGTCGVCVNVKTCLSDASVASATVTLSRDGETIGTCTTDETGQCCFDVTSEGSGTYKATATKSGYTGSNKTFDVTCPGTTNVTLYAVSGGGTVLQVKSECNGGVALGGAILDINGGTYVSDSSGNIHYTLPNGSFPWTLSWSPRFVTQTGTASRVICGAITGLSSPKTLAVASGYHCSGYLGFNGIPLADTLYGTDSVYGGLTATWTSSIFGSGTAGWEVSPTSFNTAAVCSCAAQSGVEIQMNTLSGNVFLQGYNNFGSGGHFCPKSGSGPHAPSGTWSVTTLTGPPSYLLVQTIGACNPCVGSDCASGGGNYRFLYPSGGTQTWTE